MEVRLVHCKMFRQEKLTFCTIVAAYSMQPPCGSSSTGVIVADGARANVQGNQIYNGPVYQAPVHQAPVFHFNMCSGVMFLFCLVCVLLVFYPGIRYIRADSQARLGPSNSSPSLNRTRRGGTFRGRGHVRRINYIRHKGDKLYTIIVVIFPFHLSLIYDS